MVWGCACRTCPPRLRPSEKVFPQCLQGNTASSAEVKQLAKLAQLQLRFVKERSMFGIKNFAAMLNARSPAFVPGHAQERDEEHLL